MENNKENVQRNEHYTQVCVWPGTLLKPEEVPDFEQWILKEFGTRIQFLETIVTSPDKENGKDVEGTGGRHDVFFAVHEEDIGKFAVPRLSAGMRWIEDVLSKHNYRTKIYPKRVFEYKTWEA